MGKLFEDPDFPATDAALYFEPKNHQNSKIQWLRPKVCVVEIILFVSKI